MAITKLLRLKESRSGNKASHLKHNLFYICDTAKTGGGAWIGGNAGSVPEIIYDTMIQNKKNWGKEEGSQGFHYVISFPPELDISHETICKIAEDFAQRLLGGRFYYAYAVHDDHRHKHVHITFDSVSFVDGYKFHSPKGDWEKRIQPITDEICRKYDLPPLYFNDKKVGKTYGQWKNDQNRMNGNRRIDVTWYDLIRDDIDEAISHSESFEEFLQYLKEKGYQIRLGKYLSLRPYGKERAVRSSCLGAGYRIEDIKERIKTGTRKSNIDGFVRYGDAEEIRILFKMKRSRKPSFKMTPFQKRYLKRWANSYLRNKPGRKEPWKTNADVIRVRKLSGAIKYMVDHDIGTLEDLEKRRGAVFKERESLLARKKELTSKLYKRYPLRQLVRYEKLINSSRGSDANADEMALLKAKIEDGYGLENAQKLLKKTREEIEEIRHMEESIKEQERIINDALTFYFDMPQAITKESIHKKEKSGPLRKEGSLKEKMHRSRISVHRTLIQGEDESSYDIRIPGEKTLIRIPKEDTYLYKSGDILSAFLYDEETYPLFSMERENTGQALGKELIPHFDKRNDRFRSKGR